jgi:hypothetical protein
MGLDVYVGSLTRYYMRDWETVVQKWGREQGHPVRIIRTNEPEAAPPDPAETLQIILDWRAAINGGLGENLEAPLAWNESPDAPFFTDKPGWTCYDDLRLWAAYEEHPDLSRPTDHAADMSSDPAYAASTAEDFRSRYFHLLSGAEIWLPCDFSFTFRGPDLSENTVTFGSSVQLVRELEELNHRTWKADDQTLATWPKEWFECGTPLDRGARFAFSIFLALGRQSVKHRLPMKLDY